MKILLQFLLLIIFIIQGHSYAQSQVHGNIKYYKGYFVSAPQSFGYFAFTDDVKHAYSFCFANAPHWFVNKAKHQNIHFSTITTLIYMEFTGEVVLKEDIDARSGARDGAPYILTYKIYKTEYVSSKKNVKKIAERYKIFNFDLDY